MHVLRGKYLLKKVVKIYKSFEEESLADSRRRSSMTISERLDEFAIIQERVWGELWTKTPISKKVSFEELSWSIQT